MASVCLLRLIIDRSDLRSLRCHQDEGVLKVLISMRQLHNWNSFPQLISKSQLMLARPINTKYSHTKSNMEQSLSFSQQRRHLMNLNCLSRLWNRLLGQQDCLIQLLMFIQNHEIFQCLLNLLINYSKRSLIQKHMLIKKKSKNLILDQIYRTSLMRKIE